MAGSKLVGQVTRIESLSNKSGDRWFQALPALFELRFKQRFGEQINVHVQG